MSLLPCCRKATLRSCVVLASVALLHAEPAWQGPVDAGNIKGATAVVVADFNKDGLADIGVFEGGKGNKDRQYLHWLEAPDWKAHAIDSTMLGRFTGSAGAADFNGDGWIDVAVPEDNHGGGDARLYLYLNPGGDQVTGHWKRIQIYELEKCFHQNDMAVDDMDADGKPDIIVRAKGQNRVIVAMQDSPENWTTRTWPLSNAKDGRKSEGIATGDLDDDGVPEIVLSGEYWTAPGGWRTGEPSKHVIDPAFADEEVKAFVGDFDGDGRNDIYMASAEGKGVHAAWYRNDGTPADGPWPRTMLREGDGSLHFVAGGDIDGDGDIDIVAGRAFRKKGVLIFANDGQGNFTINEIPDSESYYNGGLGDLDGDGDPDLAGAAGYSHGQPVQIYWNPAKAPEAR